jgi:hypothetical protein
VDQLVKIKAVKNYNFLIVFFTTCLTCLFQFGIGELIASKEVPKIVAQIDEIG